MLFWHHDEKLERRKKKRVLYEVCHAVDAIKRIGTMPGLHLLNVELHPWSYTRMQCNCLKIAGHNLDK